MATTDHVCQRIAARLATPGTGPIAGWTPPSPSDLIARIDAALGGRRPN